MLKNKILLVWWLSLIMTPITYGQVVNTIPVNVVGSSDPIPGPGSYFMHPFTPSPITGTYHGGTYFGGTKEKWGYNITGLTIGDLYTLTVYYMMDVVQLTPGTNRVGDLSMLSGAPLSVVTIPYIPPANWQNWYTLTTTFTAVSATDRIDIEADGINDNALWLFTDMAFDGSPSACDDLTLVVTPATAEICLGDPLTLDATSVNAGLITWDGGAVDGVPFVPAVTGTITYTATSTHPDDCPFTTDVIINPLLPVTAAADNTTICLGETVTLTGAGAASYAWDGGVVDGVPFTPAVTTVYTVTGTDVNGCINTDAVTVTVNTTPIIDAGIDIAICQGDPVTLNGTGAGTGGTYLWDGGLTDGTVFFPIATTIYTVIGTDSSGCQGTDVVTVTVNPTPTVDAGLDVSVCNGEMVTLTGAGTATGYAWDGGVVDGIPFSPSTTTVYTVTGTSATGCTNTDVVTVTVNAILTIDAGADVSVCQGEAVTLSGTGAGALGMYVWDGGITDGVSFSPGGTTTIYNLTGTDANGCIGTDNVSVTVNPLPNPDFSPDVMQGCDPLTVNFSEIAGVPASAGCLWDFGDGTVATACGLVSNTFNDAGDYNVTLTTTTIDGCQDISPIQVITVTSLPDANFAFNPQVLTIENTEVTFTNSSINADTYDWDFGDGSLASSVTDPVHNYPNTAPGEYLVTLTAFNNNGTCVDITSQLIIIKDVIIFYIPNVFTPDGDLFNETFQPVFYSGFDPYDFHMQIFNRWGEVVFETYDASKGWDGTYGGHGLVKDGTYVWKIDFKETMSDKRHSHDGHVTVLK